MAFQTAIIITQVKHKVINIYFKIDYPCDKVSVHTQKMKKKNIEEWIARGLMFCHLFYFVEFCETCVVVNPNEPKYVNKKIFFNTGCQNARCTADLKVKSSLENVPR